QATGTPDSFQWRISTDGGATFGAWSSPVSVDGSAQSLSNGITVTFGATTGHTLGDTWQYVTWTTAFTDNLAFGSPLIDLRWKLPTISEVGVNYGLRGGYVESAGPEAPWSVIKSKELRGTNAPARSFPGKVKVEFPFKRDARAI